MVRLCPIPGDRSERKMAYKFQALDISYLLTDERNAGRVARNATRVVFVEVDDGSWCELDADSDEHARVLCHNWVDKLNARGCSAWNVAADGRIVPGPIATYYWEGDHG
jgi:hypothetical protein